MKKNQTYILLGLRTPGHPASKRSLLALSQCSLLANKLTKSQRHLRKAAHFLLTAVVPRTTQVLGNRVLRGALGKVPGLNLELIPGSTATQNYRLMVRLSDLLRISTPQSTRRQLCDT